MRLSVVTLALSACVWAAAADISHVKTRLLGRLSGKHHKRGILSAIPPFKLGHDIPYVTHSVVKPLVVTYPPTASVAAVKIPVSGPHGPRYPVPVGHKVPGLPHPHYGLKFPHTKVIENSDHHFHHHHHHVAPRPIVPIVPAPIPATPVTHVAPVASAPPQSVTIAHAAPGPPLSVVSAPVIPAHPVPVPAPPLPAIPNNLHLRPLLPAATVPIPPTPILPAPALSAPVLPLSQPFPYILRPGGALQSSVFATFPRYPFLNSYQSPLFSLAPPSLAPTIPQLLLQRPHVQQYLVPHTATPHGVLEQHTPNIAIEQTPTYFHSTQVAPQPAVHLNPAQEVITQPGLHLHPTQVVPQATIPLPTQSTVAVEHDGWSPVQAPAQPHDLATSHEAQFPQQQTNHFTQEHGTQVYEQHTENQFHDYQHQLQHHIQQQIEQAQYEQSLQTQQQQPAPEYGVPQQLGQEYAQPNEYSQQGQDFSQHQQDFSHVQDFAQNNQNFDQHGQHFAQPGQDFAQHGQNFAQHGQDFSHQGQDFSQNGQDFSQHGQDFSQHGQDFSQNGQDFNQNNYNVAHVSQEYGLPHQGVEGRSGEDNDQQYHNHIPLGLQPPIDRPLDHFQ